MAPSIDESNEKLKQDLRIQIKEYELALAARKQMLQMLGDTGEERVPVRPRTRAWLLRSYLENSSPGGIAIHAVPRVLSEMGFLSKEKIPTTNWLRQLKPEWQFFVIKQGWVSLRDDLAEIDKKYQHGAEFSDPLALHVPSPE